MVSLAANGADALESALDTPFDVCIIDSNLTDMDGFEVSERLRHESEWDATIIMLVDPCNDLRKSYLAAMVTYAGGDYFFAKPCDDHLLLMLLEDIDGARGCSGPVGSPKSSGRTRRPAGRVGSSLLSS